MAGQQHLHAGSAPSLGKFQCQHRLARPRPSRADDPVVGLDNVDVDAATQAEWDAALAGAPAQWLAEQTDKTAAEAVLTRAQAIAGE